MHCLFQAHHVYAELTEAKQQFDQMAEDNQKILSEIKESLDQTVEESSQKSLEEQEDAQQKMWEHGMVSKESEYSLKLSNIC